MGSIEMKKSKLLILGPLFAYGGGEVISQGEILAEKLRASGYPVMTASHKSNLFLKYFDILFSAIKRRNRYDLAIVMVFSGRSFVIAEILSFILKRMNKPFILWLHGGNLPLFARKHPRRVQNTLKKANSVISPSSYLKDKLIDLQPDIAVIPNLVDISSHNFIHRVSPIAQLVWIRAFHKIYNPWLAPEVINLLIKDFPDIKLTMVGPDKGDGSFEKTLELTDRLGVINNIQFPGLVPKANVPEWLNKGDIFINTTNVDNTPVSMIEAMACGLCIVSTNVGGIPYLLQDGVDALLVPPEDPEAMANAVKRILTDPQLAASLSANARKKAEAFSWEKVLPTWEGLFHEILGESEDL